MKAKLSLLISFFYFMHLCGQERYFVNAPNGLNVRESTTTNAAKVGKLTYGALVEIVDATDSGYEVKEEGQTFSSRWVKIKYDNFPYVNSNKPSYQWDRTGYVVQYYLKELNRGHIVSHSIDSTTFYDLYKKPPSYNPVKITSFEEVKKKLDGRVKWGTNPFVDESQLVLKSIDLPNGQQLEVDKDVVDFTFKAYYPAEEILVFEGGHNSDFSIDLTTGETLETTGNPEYIVASPLQEYRLNGWFSGHECSNYFFQKKRGDRYTYFAELTEDICNLTKFNWLSEKEFIYSYMDYSNHEKVTEKYRMGSVSVRESANLGSFRNSNFKEILGTMPSRSLPLTEATNFDDFIEAEDYKLLDAHTLRLEKIYADFNDKNYNYRAIRSYRVEISKSFYSVVVTLLKGDHEMETVLVNYDLSGTIIDSKVVSYDEIAEGQSQINSKIKKDLLIVDTIFWADEKQVTTTTFKILKNGEISSMKVHFEK